MLSPRTLFFCLQNYTLVCVESIHERKKGSFFVYFVGLPVCDTSSNSIALVSPCMLSHISPVVVFTVALALSLRIFFLFAEEKYSAWNLSFQSLANTFHGYIHPDRHLESLQPHFSLFATPQHINFFLRQFLSNQLNI